MGKCKCGKEVPGQRQVNFVHDGVRFAFQDYLNRCFDCAKLERVSVFEKFKNKFFKIENGQIVIDWNLFCLEYNKGSERAKTFGYLLSDIGILTLSALGSWNIVTDGHPIGLNPAIGSVYSYFKRKEDAMEYARVSLKSSCGWHIAFTEVVLHPEDVFAKERV